MRIEIRVFMIVFIRFVKERFSLSAIRCNSALSSLVKVKRTCVLSFPIAIFTPPLYIIQTLYNHNKNISSYITLHIEIIYKI